MNSNCWFSIWSFTPNVWVGTCDLCLYCDWYYFWPCLSALPLPLMYLRPWQFYARHVQVHINPQYNSDTSSMTMSSTYIKLFSLKAWIHSKPDEGAEVHLLRTNDWMHTHAFPGGFKVQRFSQTLVGEARLWYESLRLIAMDWNGFVTSVKALIFQNSNTREQLFNAWKSFHFDENSETIDKYVTYIQQVASLLWCGEPLEVLKNTLPWRLHLVLSPREDFRQAVERAKRILTKEKIDRQLAVQSICSPFMSIKDSCGCNKKTVLFNSQNFATAKLINSVPWWVNYPSRIITKVNHLSIKSFKEKGEVKEGVIVMTEVGSKEEIDKVAEKN